MAEMLQTPIEYLRNVGPARADLLKKELELFRYSDLLRHYPFRYVDRSKIYPITEVSPDYAFVQVKGRFVSLDMTGEKRAKRLVGIFRDPSGNMEVVWFQGAQWVGKMLQLNKEYVLFGKPALFGNRLSMAHPEIETAEDFNKEKIAGLQPVYSTTEKLKAKGLDSKGLLKLVKTLLDDPYFKMPEIFPEQLLQQYQLLPRAAAYRQIHFPASDTLYRQALFRIKFEEFLFIQLKLLMVKGLRKKAYRGIPFPTIGDHFHAFYTHHLPFELTNAQKRVIKEIRADVASGKQMNRLLQGDVGSGKTIVAFLVMLIALDNNTQACMMAPTEILARQHFESLSEMAAPLGIQVRLLTGSTPAAARKKIHAELEAGSLHILVGTHALIEDHVQFHQLGLVIIDEQHRFGVEQRARLWRKGQSVPHILVMTATPIPRTLAMTLYGDLDVSVIDELPAGRKPIETAHRFESHRLRVFGFIKEQIRLGRQVYIVYPLIEESETLDFQNLQQGYESVTRAFPSPEYQVSIVHGRMKADAKEWEMNRFKKGETQIMVATTVIEVGVNVPNASVMIIESAERFGLSQLHQLRGRVGRGAEQSYCILMTSFRLGADARQRMDAMVRTSNGFEIADLDLKLRGPGDMDGLRQSGVTSLKLAELGKDDDILKLARVAAEELLTLDPELSSPGNIPLVAELRQVFKDGNWSRIS